MPFTACIHGMKCSATGPHVFASFLRTGCQQQRPAGRVRELLHTDLLSTVLIVVIVLAAPAIATSSTVTVCIQSEYAEVTCC